MVKLSRSFSSLRLKHLPAAAPGEWFSSSDFEAKSLELPGRVHQFDQGRGWRPSSSKGGTELFQFGSKHDREKKHGPTRAEGGSAAVPIFSADGRDTPRFTSRPTSSVSESQGPCEGPPGVCSPRRRWRV